MLRTKGSGERSGEPKSMWVSLTLQGGLYNVQNLFIRREGMMNPRTNWIQC